MKNILIIITAIFVVVFTQQLVLMNKYEANLIFWVDNSSGDDNLTIEVSIDGKAIELIPMENDLFFNYVSRLKTPIGKKTITVNVNNGQIIKEKDIFLLFVRWLRVGVGYKYGGKTSEDEELLISIRSSFTEPGYN